MARKIIGLDLGHGDTAAAVIRLDDNLNKIYDNLNLAETGDTKKIITNLFLSADETIVKIGDDIMNGNLPPGRIYKGFKARPDLLPKQKIGGHTKEKLLKLYAKAVLDKLFELNSGILSRKDTIEIVVGCPSDDKWLQYREDYERILMEALHFPVKVMPESRAAIIKTYHEYGKEIDVSSGTIVFDAGSSTFDSTYINEEGKRLSTLDQSMALGASYIEGELFKTKLKEKNLDYNDMQDPVKSEIEIRRLKERYFDEEAKGIGMPVVGVYLPLKDKEREYPEFKANKVTMEKVIKEKTIIIPIKSNLPNCTTWYDGCKNFLMDIKNKIGENPIETVILTGGASKMPFLQKLCKEVFPKRKLIVDKEPSYCVSRGLVLAGYTDKEAASLFSITEKNVKQKIKNTIGGYLDQLAELYAVSCFHCMEQRLKNWSLLEEDTETLKQVCAFIESDFQQYIKAKAAKKAVNQKFIVWIDGIRAIIVSEVNKSFANKYPNAIKNIPPFSINDQEWRKLRESILDNKNLQIQMNRILNQLELDNYMEVAGKSIVFVIKFILVGITKLMSEKWAKKIDDSFDRTFFNQMDKKFSQKQRKKAYDHFCEKQQEILNKQLKPAILEQLQKEVQEEEVVKAIYEKLNPVIQKAVDTISMHFV